MRFNLLRFTNSMILVCVVILTLTGVYGLFWTFNGWLFDVHRIAGWALIGCIPWKTAISLRSLRRGLQPNLERGLFVFISLFLAVVSLAVIGLGLAWTLQIGPQLLWLRQTAISWHWMLGLGLLAPFLLHVWRRWPQPKKIDFTSRRAALKMIGLGAAAMGSWWGAEVLAAWRTRPEAPRRYTGSRLDGSFSGNRFPVTHTIAAREDQVDPLTWRLVVEGVVDRPGTFDYQALLGLPAADKIATLDCTLGWYTVQNWSGITLRDLLAELGVSPQAAGVRFESVTGYAHILPMGEAKDVLLATHVGGEPLEHWHGFPLRAVVPSRRGWFWVKWLQRIEVLSLDFMQRRSALDALLS